MNIFTLFNLSFEALRERRLRASLTTLMVVMGASLIVALNGTGNGFSNFVDDQFRSLGANVLILSARGENIDINTKLTDELARFPDVDEVIPYIQQISTISYAGEAMTAIVVGVDQAKLPLLFPTLSFQEGTFTSESDRVGITLGNEAAFFSNEKIATLGQTIKINYQTYEDQRPIFLQRSFVVRGVLNYVGSGIVPVDQMVFLSTSSANSFFDRGGNFDGVYIVTANPELNDGVQQRVEDVYGSDLTIVSPQMIAEVIQQITSGVYLFINSVAMVSLLVASVGIITTVNTSMMERIKEIGLLKALGFDRRAILGLFLCEAMIIGILGGSLGVTGGVGLSYGMTTLLGRNLQFGAGGGGFSLQLIPAFDPLNLVSAWLLCIALSIISGLYPSWRASRLDAVEALRHE